MNQKGFTLIEILIVIAIIIIIAFFAIPTYQKIVSSAKCGAHKDQHKKVVDLANNTYNMCRLNGSTYMNINQPCSNRSRYVSVLKKRSGMTQIRQEGNKCVREWDCKTDHVGRQQNAGLSSGWFFDHVRAEFDEPSHTGSFVRNDQWQNFLKPNYPSRPGITNIREKGVNMHIATFLGPSCSGGDYTNSGGSYLVDEIVWP